MEPCGLRFSAGAFHLSGMSTPHRLAGATNRGESRSFDAWPDRMLLEYK